MRGINHIYTYNLKDSVSKEEKKKDLKEWYDNDQTNDSFLSVSVHL